MKIHRFLQGSAIDLAQAFRNVLRQKRRVAFALAIVMGGCISLLLAGGFIQWVLDTMRESTIRSQLGHIQIVRTDYYKKGIADPYKYLLPADGSKEAEVLKHPSVRAIAPRLSLVGLISLAPVEQDTWWQQSHLVPHFLMVADWSKNLILGFTSQWLASGISAPADLPFKEQLLGPKTP